MLDLRGRIAVVTGAGTGIGRAIALRLSRRGARMALLGRTASALEKVADECPTEALWLPTDVSRRSQVDQAFSAVVDRLGPPHAVVANAGAGGPNAPGEGDRWDEIVRANLDGAYFCLRAFEATMASEGPKHAVVISSCVARFGVPGISAYSAAKAGQLGLVRSLAAELAPKGVRVNAICPGWVDTQMAVDRMHEMAREMGKPYAQARDELLSQVPLQRISEPDEIAGLVEFLLSPDAAGFTGQALDPNNGAWMG